MTLTKEMLDRCRSSIMGYGTVESKDAAELVISVEKLRDALTEALIDGCCCATVKCTPCETLLEVFGSNEGGE